MRRSLYPDFQGNITMVTDGSFATTDDSFIRNCYEFEYDEAGRVTGSRTPGATARKRTVYSAAGRVVAEHTAAMGDNTWFVHFYDDKGRLCYTANAGLVEEEVESLKRTFSVAEYNGSTEYGGYRLTPQPDAPVDEPFSAVYYDDYRFLNMPGASTLPKVSGNRAGLQTGAYDASTGFSATVYDDWGRIVGTHEKTAKGVLSSEYKLDRSGAPLSVTTTLNGSVISQSNSYDNAGRLTSWSTALGGSTASGTLSYGPLGSVIKESFGNSVSRSYAYDCHGWVEQITTTVPVPSGRWPGEKLATDDVAGISAPFYNEAYGVEPSWEVVPSPGFTPMTDYTESILYGSGLNPRWDGTASAHVSSLGGRYDYSFDCHDRLVKADYNAESRGEFQSSLIEDFSTEYSYNEAGAPLQVKRKGVTAIQMFGERTTEYFGVTDELSYDWDGMTLGSVTAQAHGSEYYGRTGYQLSAKGGEGQYVWDKAGLLYSDSARGITKTTYNWNGQPQKVTFADGGYLSYAYRADGSLKSVATYAVLTEGKLPKKVSERSYIGGFVFEGDSLAYVNFAGGYFDGEGKPHYRHPDFQGNITMVTDATGKVEQHTGYYPYGEPWREPTGQPWLFGDKERMRDNGLNEYDFSARRLNAALCLWTTPDPLAQKFANTNPYAYCAGNPIKFIDPSGCVIEDPSGLKENFVKKLLLMRSTAEKLNVKGALQLFDFCNSQLKQIEKLEKSKNVYIVDYTEKSTGYTSVDANTGNILIYVPSGASSEQQITFTAHELQHGYQFENGKVSLYPEGTNKLPTLNDMTDEMEAFKVMNIMQNGIYYFTHPDAISDLETPIANGDPQQFPNRWNEEIIRTIGGGYENLPNKNIRIKNKKDPIILVLQRNNEYYNRYKYGN